MVRRNSDQPFTEWLFNVACFAETEAELAEAYMKNHDIPAQLANRFAGQVFMITGGEPAPIPASADDPIEATPATYSNGESATSSGSNEDDGLEGLDNEELRQKVLELAEEHS